MCIIPQIQTGDYVTNVARNSAEASVVRVVEENGKIIVTFVSISCRKVSRYELHILHYGMQRYHNEKNIL